MKLISSKIVPADHDAFWQPLPADWQSLPPCTLLALTQPYDRGSTAAATLSNMLKACKLAPTNYHILMLAADQQVAWHALQAALQPRYVLLLGIRPAQLGISALLSLYATNSFGDCVFMPADALPELEQNPEARKQLWTGVLKPLFVDKV